jgi:hypothetical protein
MKKLSGRWLALILSVTIWALPSSAQGGCSFLRTFAVEPVSYPELRYRLVDKFGVRFCDPDCPSSCHFVREQDHAEEAFAKIKQQAETFRAIVQHLRLDTVRDFSGEQKLSIYREYKKLVCGMSFETLGDHHKFKLSATNGFRIEGNLGRNGEITVTNEELVPQICPL